MAGVSRVSFVNLDTVCSENQNSNHSHFGTATSTPSAGLAELFSDAGLHVPKRTNRTFELRNTDLPTFITTDTIMSPINVPGTVGTQFTFHAPNDPKEPSTDSLDLIDIPDTVEEYYDMPEEPVGEDVEEIDEAVIDRIVIEDYEPVEEYNDEDPVAQEETDKQLYRWVYIGTGDSEVEQACKRFVSMVHSEIRQNVDTGDIVDKSTHISIEFPLSQLKFRTKSLAMMFRKSFDDISNLILNHDVFHTIHCTLHGGDRRKLSSHKTLSTVMEFATNMHSVVMQLHDLLVTRQDNSAAHLTEAYQLLATTVASGKPLEKMCSTMQQIIDVADSPIIPDPTPDQIVIIVREMSARHNLNISQIPDHLLQTVFCRPRFRIRTVASMISALKTLVMQNITRVYQTIIENHTPMFSVQTINDMLCDNLDIPSTNNAIDSMVIRLSSLSPETALDLSMAKDEDDSDADEDYDTFCEVPRLSTPSFVFSTQQLQFSISNHNLLTETLRPHLYTDEWTVRGDGALARLRFEHSCADAMVQDVNHDEMAALSLAQTLDEAQEWLRSIEHVHGRDRMFSITYAYRVAILSAVTAEPTIKYVPTSANQHKAKRDMVEGFRLLRLGSGIKCPCCLNIGACTGLVSCATGTDSNGHLEYTMLPPFNVVPYGILEAFLWTRYVYCLGAHPITKQTPNLVYLHEVVFPAAWWLHQSTMPDLYNRLGTRGNSGQDRIPFTDIAHKILDTQSSMFDYENHLLRHDSGAYARCVPNHKYNVAYPQNCTVRPCAVNSKRQHIYTPNSHRKTFEHTHKPVHDSDILNGGLQVLGNVILHFGSPENMIQTMFAK